MTRFTILTFALLICPAPALANQVAAGRAIAELNCAACHATDLTDESPHVDAPPFRELASRYPLEALEEALAEGIDVGHRDMPIFQMTPTQMASFLAYLETIQKERE